MTGDRMRVGVGAVLVFLSTACGGQAGGIGSAMYYGPYTGGHGYSYNTAYSYALPFTANGFSSPWTYPYDWTGYPYRGLAFPAKGTYGWPKVVPIPAEAECAGPPGPPAPVKVLVHVPADAVVWFDGVPTEMKGPNRLFESPPLDRDKSFTYTVRAEWSENGKTVVQVQMVSVRRGQQTDVTFP